jgi:transcriptional regulator with XRE-family HTH domain
MNGTQPRTMTLVELRLMAGKTQKEVAASMGISRGRIPQIEADYPNVMYPVLQGYLAALGAGIQFRIPGGEVVRAEDVVLDPARKTTRERREKYPDDVRYG